MDLLNSIWDSLLDAELNERYLDYFRRRYYQRDKYIKIFLAVMTSGTVASWSIWADIPFLWKMLSTIAALTAIIFPLLKLESIIEKISPAMAKWKEVRNDYEFLYLSIMTKDRNELMSEYKEIKNKELNIEDVNLPYKRDLILKIQDEIIMARGLTNEPKEVKSDD